MKIITKILSAGILKKCFLYFFLISALMGQPIKAETNSLLINLDPKDTGGAEPNYITTFTEGDLPVNITAPDAVIEDTEGIGINYITVSITNPKPGDVLIADTSGTNIIFQYDKNCLTLTGITPEGLNTAQHYQQVLRNIKFNNSGVNPDISRRIIEFTAFSGQSPGNTVRCFLIIVSVNSPPVNTVPGPQMTPKNVPLIFNSNNGNRISVSDEEAEAGEIQVSLTVDKGSLSLPHSDSKITGNNTADINITGTIVQVNSELNGLKYEPEPDWFGKVYLNIKTSDLGYSGIPGPLTDLDSIEITVGVTTKPPDEEPDAVFAVFNEGETVILDASDSIGTMKTYEWLQISGPDVFLSDNTIANPSFVAPIINSQAVRLIFELKSENQEGTKFTTQIIIQINDNGIIGFPEDVLTFRPNTRTEMGIKIIEGELVSIKGISPDQIEAAENRPENLIYGLINMQIKVLTPTQEAVAEIYFSEPVDNEFKWFGFHENSGWTEYGENAVLSEDKRHITLYLTKYLNNITPDTIPENNIINDTSGLGKPSTISESGAGESGGGCFIIVLDLKNNLNHFFKKAH